MLTFRPRYGLTLLVALTAWIVISCASKTAGETNMEPEKQRISGYDCLWQFTVPHPSPFGDVERVTATLTRWPRGRPIEQAVSLEAPAVYLTIAGTYQIVFSPLEGGSAFPEYTRWIHCNEDGTTGELREEGIPRTL